MSVMNKFVNLRVAVTAHGGTAVTSNDLQIKYINDLHLGTKTPRSVLMQPSIWILVGNAAAR